MTKDEQIETLTHALQRVINITKSSTPYTTSAYAHLIAYKSLEKIGRLDECEGNDVYTFIVTIHLYNGIRTNVHKEQMSIEAESSGAAAKQLIEEITNRYKRLDHIGLSGVQLELV
ncbi:hypothetical protein [Priestia megaterium]|uniref:hypothetical protein n=1 Tax=Priestia megaterium TaxID=1404 RepID=UPI00300A2667